VSRIHSSIAVALFAIAASAQANAASLCYSGDPPARFRAQGAQVIDTQTGLTWQRCSAGQRWDDAFGCVGVIRQMTWNDARKLETDGWRLPTRVELATLVDSACGSPTIDERAFPDMELTKLWYWTGTADGALVWYVAFGGGSERLGSPNAWIAVRLVRDKR
jgi:hypothetical protein